jgi:nonsense-mediated mRNA decay protein 3
MRKCPICGNETEYEICPDCYMEREEIIEFKPYLEVKYCPKCGRFYSKGWVESDLEEIVLDKAAENMKHDPAFRVRAFELKELGENNGIVLLEGSFLGKDVVRELPFELRRKGEVCDRCSRFYGGYFESIIQLRADGRELEKDEISRAKELVDEAIQREKDNPGAFVSKVEERKEGIDFYIGSRNLAKKISRRIEEELGGKITESKKISGRKDGRDLFRTTYSVRLKAYRKGDVVRDGDRVLIVTNPIKDKGVDASGRSFALKEPVLIKRREDLQQTVVVDVDESVIEVLRPADQKPVQAEKHADMRIGDTAIYLEENGAVYVFPIWIKGDYGHEKQINKKSNKSSKRGS